MSGWIAKLNGDVISWSSKKQSSVALSSCEAELYAVASVTQEVLWMRGMMEELGFGLAAPSTVYCDNQSTIAISKNGIKTGRTKQVHVRYSFITDEINKGNIKPQWVATTEQHADILTKALGVQPFTACRKKLMTDQ